MNRLTKAWKALRGTLEPEVREIEVVREVQVMGTPEPCVLFAVSVKTGKKKMIGEYPYQFEANEYVNEYFATCEQAHSAHPSQAVTNCHMWRIGGRYFSDLKIEEVKLQPKSKRPKGKASA